MFSLFFGIPVLLVAGWVGGVFLLMLGLRGRRIGDHPYCRRCNFDLFGLPDSSKKCPECGVDLTSPAAIVVGLRKRNIRQCAWGSALTTIASAALIGIGVSIMRGVDFVPHLPTAWLIYETTHAQPPTSQRMLNELLNRMKAGTLSASQIDRIVQKALDVQGNAQAIWWPQWGDFIELAQAGGSLSAADWQRYFRQAASAEMSMRSVMARGDPLIFQVQASNLRVGSGTFYEIKGKVVDAKIDNVSMDRMPGGETYDFHYLRRSGIQSGGAARSRLRLPDDLWASLSDGTHLFELNVEVFAFDLKTWGKPAISETATALKTTFKIEPIGPLTPQIVPGNSATRQLRSAISVDDVIGSRRGQITISVVYHDAPGFGKLKGFLRLGEQEWPLDGTLVVRAGSGSTMFSIPNPPQELVDGVSLLVLRPLADAGSTRTALAVPKIYEEFTVPEPVILWRP